MSPTEFSNYIKQRAMQQQIHHHHHHQQQQHQQPGPQGPQTPGGLPVSQSSPNSRSLSPGLAAVNGHNQHAAVAAAAAAASDPSAYFFHQAPPPAYHPQFPHRSIFDSTSSHNGYIAAAAAAAATDLYTGAKFPSSYLDPGTIGHQFYGGVGAGGSGAATQNGATALGPIGSAATAAAAAVAATGAASTVATQQQQNDKAALVDGLNNFGLGSVTPYPASNYQHLLVAN